MVEDERRAREEADRKLPPTVLITVTTLSESDPPKVSMTGEGSTRTVTVGDVVFVVDTDTMDVK